MSTGHVSLPLPRMTSAPSKDPFGSLFATAASARSASAAAPTAVQPVVPAVAPAADDDWGDSDFTEAPMQPPTSATSGFAPAMLPNYMQPSPVAVPPPTEDDWGDSDFSEAAPAGAVDNQVGVETSGQDDWGDSDFASAPSAAAETPDSLLGGNFTPGQATSPLNDGSDDLMGAPDQMVSTPGAPTETTVEASEVKTDLIASLIASNLGSVSTKSPVASKPSLLELQKQKEMTSTAGDSFDDWKPPSQAVMMASEVSVANKMAAIDALAEIDLVAETEEWDDFADGTENVAVAAPVQEVPVSSEDDWGDGFESAAPMPQPTTELEADQNQLSRSIEFGGAVSSVSRADNPFEDFDDDFMSADPAPLDSAAARNIVNPARSRSPFGEFDDASNSTVPTATVPAVSASGAADDDDWGDDTDFKTVETINKPSVADDPFEGVDGSTNSDAALASESATFSSVHDVSANKLDSHSGDHSKTTDIVTETKSSDVSDPFADIDDAAEGASPVLSAPAVTLDGNADDDDWGNDFSSDPTVGADDQAGEVGSTFKASFDGIKPDSDPEVKDSISMTTGDDDWGSGDVFATAAAPSLSIESDRVDPHGGTQSVFPSQNSVTANAGEDDEWGDDFASAPAASLPINEARTTFDSGSFDKNVSDTPAGSFASEPSKGNREANDNFAGISAPKASLDDPFGEFNNSAMAAADKHDQVNDIVVDDEAESCMLPELLEKLLSCELLNEALKCTRHMELESELTKLKVEKAEAAADDRFEDAAAYRDKINTVAGKLSPEPTILEWRSAAKHRPSGSVLDKMCAEMDETSAQKFRQTFCAGDSLVTHARRDLAGAADRLHRAKRCAVFSRAIRSSHQAQGAVWEQSLGVVSMHLALLEECLPPSSQSDLTDELVKVPTWETFVRGVAEMIGVAARLLASAQDAFWEPSSGAQLRSSQDLVDIAGRIATNLRAVKCPELANFVETRAEVGLVTAPIDAPVCALTWFPTNEEDEHTVLVEKAHCLAASGNFFVNCVQGHGGVSGLSEAPRL